MEIKKLILYMIIFFCRLVRRLSLAFIVPSIFLLFLHSALQFCENYYMHISDDCHEVVQGEPFYVAHLFGGPCLSFGRALWEVFLSLFYISLVIQWPFWLTYGISWILMKWLSLYSKETAEFPSRKARPFLQWIAVVYTGIISVWITLAIFMGLMHNPQGEYCAYTEYDGRWFHILYEKEPCYFTYYMFSEAFSFTWPALLPGYLLLSLIYCGLRCIKLICK